ncbi:MAG: hypothetical protein ED859_15495 [Desulfuromonadales bacterium]|nr:MAG: hypothetical protein ED859_15495 [Desulfuromonadales bacterium]
MTSLPSDTPAIGARVTTGRRGQATALVIGEDGRETCLHSVYDPVREAESHVPGRLDAATIVFLGTGLGYHLLPTLALNPQVTRVVIVERYPGLAAIAAERISDPSLRIELVTGMIPGGFPPLPQGLDARTLRVVPHPPSLAANPSWYDHYQVAVATAGLPGGATGKSNRRGASLTVLVPFEAYYAQRECINGLRALGHRVITLDCRGREGEEAAIFRDAVTRDRPDLVLSVNMRGLDRRGVAAEMLRRLGIPLALWFVDSPEFILYGEAMPPPDACHVFMWDRGYIPAVSRQGYRVSYLPLAADTALVDAARFEERFRADISFVGNSLVSGFLARLAVKFPAGAEAMAFADRAIDRIIARRGDQLQVLDELIAQAGHFLANDEQRLFFRAFLLHGATSAYRTRLLQRLIPLGLTFFGDPEGWKKVFGPSINAHPDVNYFHETPAVYASSAVNVNATSLQMPHTVNQRVFDVPLCNGFLLTDRQGALFELFAEDEVAVYDGIGDAAEKALYYLERPELRGNIMEKARRRVLGEHTYGHRMGQLIADL